MTRRVVVALMGVLFCVVVGVLSLPAEAQNVNSVTTIAPTAGATRLRFGSLGSGCSVTVINSSAVPIYIGGSTVTTSNGADVCDGCTLGKAVEFGYPSDHLYYVAGASQTFKGIIGGKCK